MARGKKIEARAGWIVRIGEQVIVGFRYPEPGDKRSFELQPNEKRLAAACIAVLGEGPPFEWIGSTGQASANNVAACLEGKAEEVGS